MLNWSVESLSEIAKNLVVNGKGILAADESSGTIKKRFEKVGIEDTEENHRKYRQLLFTTPEIENYISGVIMYDETIRQKDDSGKPFPELLKERGIVPGIKTDLGKVEMPFFPGEHVTEGLDGLRDRVKEYYDLGARFTKWRAVAEIGEGKPSKAVLRANAHGLARQAAYSQEAGLVPIVEPEVLMDGNHDIEQCEIVTSMWLDMVFEGLYENKVDFKGMLLKPNMVVSGKDCPDQASDEEIVELTLRAFKKSVPKDVHGIVFLSGGMSPSQATERLRLMNKTAGKESPWALSFSFGRALQEPVLNAWAGKDENITKSQEEFIKVARADSEATMAEFE